MDSCNKPRPGEQVSTAVPSAKPWSPGRRRKVVQVIVPHGRVGEQVVEGVDKFRMDVLRQSCTMVTKGEGFSSGEECGAHAPQLVRLKPHSQPAIIRPAQRADSSSNDCQASRSTGLSLSLLR